MPVPDGAVALYRRRLESYRLRTNAGLVAAWDELTTYSDPDVEAFAQKTSPLMAGAKAATVATAAAFLALALGTKPVGVKPDDIEVDPKLRDPFLATWHALNMERGIDEAVVVGRSAAEAVGWDFIESTARQTGDHVSRATGRSILWQRIPGAGACDFCITASGQLYHSADSADFGHNRCSCSVVPA